MDMPLYNASRTDTPAAISERVTETVFEDIPDGPTRDYMDFALVYWDTTLKASNRRSGHSLEKHQIRRAFSEQLENLWKIHPNLTAFDPRGEQRNAYAKEFKISDTEFVPLVLEKWNLLCELDITLLRSGNQRRVVSDGGDLDNRLKTLIDALRVPRNGGEMPIKSGEESPSRIYCLLEDDKLITSIKVTSDRLLAIKASGEEEFCVTIRAKVLGTSIVASPWAFR
jgi:hypothetical protein